MKRMDIVDVHGKEKEIKKLECKERIYIYSWKKRKKFNNEPYYIQRN